MLQTFRCELRVSLKFIGYYGETSDDPGGGVHQQDAGSELLLKLDRLQEGRAALPLLVVSAAGEPQQSVRNLLVVVVFDLHLLFKLIL